jgi:hypothetical protein
VEDRYVLNALDKEVHVKAFGNHFSFKPGQIKRFSKDIGDFLTKEKGYLGLVGLPSDFDSLDFQNSDEGKAILETKKQEGVRARIRVLEQQVYNLQVSLRQDLEIKNIKADPYIFASDGDVAAMEELAKLQREGKDEDKAKIERLRQLERDLKKNSNIKKD